MMKLYFNQFSRAVRVRWMLEELGVPYELHKVDFDSDELDSPEYRAIHPLGLIPAVVEGDYKLYESGALVLWLADRYPEKELAPAPGTKERGLYYQWAFHTFAELEQPLVEIFAQTQMLEESERSAANLKWAQETWATRIAALEKYFASHEYAVGGKFTAADVVLGGVLGWAMMMGQLSGYPAVEVYAKRVGGRPAAKKARGE
jgi:glutathione S-transferase